MGLTPITEKKFRKKLKGCGIKNYSLIPKKELKEKLGFYSKNKPQRKVEISDDYGFQEFFKVWQMRPKYVKSQMHQQ